jgi:hypothetical protein
MAEEIRAGDVGTAFRYRILDQDGNPFDLSTATALRLFFEVPGGEVTEHTASLVGDGTDGLLQYVGASGDIPRGGNYRVQAKVTRPDGEWGTSLDSFVAHRNLY